MTLLTRGIPHGFLWTIESILYAEYPREGPPLCKGTAVSQYSKVLHEPKMKQESCRLWWVSSIQTQDTSHLTHALMSICSRISWKSIIENGKGTPTLSPSEYFKLHPVSAPGTDSALSARVRAHGSDPTHCGCLWSPDQVSKEKGQKSRDLLKIVENSSGHDWHLIFLQALAPHQIRAKITSDTSPQTFLSSSSERCGASCHPLSISFGMPLPFRSKELWFCWHLR